MSKKPDTACGSHENQMIQDLPLHTKEPWTAYYNEKRNMFIVGDSSGEDVADFMNNPQDEANAKRIVAAVNFCEGFSNEDLAKMGSLKDVEDQNYALTKWRSAKGNPYPDLLVITKQQAGELKYLAEIGKTDEVSDRLFSLLMYGRITPPKDKDDD